MNIPINLDKITNLEYDDDNYVVIVTYKYLYFFRKEMIIRGVLRKDFEKMYRQWNTHRTMVFPKIIQ